MSQTQRLLTVEYHTDDELGIYDVGEIDFGVSSMLEDYLKRYGADGKDEIVKTLAYLIHAVQQRMSELTPRDGQPYVTKSAAP